MVKDEGSDSMRMWGALLRYLRLAAGITLEELAEFVGYSKSLVVGVERGLRMPNAHFVSRSDECVRAGGLLVAAAAHLSRQRFLSWGQEYAESECRARTLMAYSTHVLHELLQTEGYARAVLSARRPVMGDEEIEAAVAALAERQTLLTRQPVCALGFVIEEWVLRRAAGGPTVMREQLQHLVEVSALRNVTVQIMPSSVDLHAGVDGPLTLLETPEHTWIAYIDAHSSSQMLDDAQQVSMLHDRMSMIRSQALTPRDSRNFIQQLAG
jgi:Domain of unknown function (DUF5753)/Helix-turn-helix domain